MFYWMNAEKTQGKCYFTCVTVLCFVLGCTLIVFVNRGKASLANSFESFVFSLLYGLPCANKPGEALVGDRAAVQAFRKPHKNLNGLKIYSRCGF